MASTGFVRPNSKCPVCGAAVYYYESAEGGRVYFDELGPPWPKHPCTANRSSKVSNLTDLLAFTGERLAPEKAMLLAAELVKHALCDFRAPKRKFPSDEVMRARADLIEWLFRRHGTGEEYLVPLDEFMKIVGYIESRSRQSIVSAALFEDPRKHSYMPDAEEFCASWAKRSATAKATLRMMEDLRSFYEERDDAPLAEVSTEGKETSETIIRLNDRRAPPKSE